MSYEFEPACRRMEWLDPFYRNVWEKAFAETIPISGTFELTPRCNFNCRMCYVHLEENEIPRYGRELSAKEWIRIAEEAKAAGTTWLCITGGEPLMHPEFETIWKTLDQMGFFITLQTNASMIRGNILKLLQEYPPWIAKVTLYGSNNEVYEAVCGEKNGFDRVNTGIENLLKLKIPVQLVSTVVKQNSDDIRQMAYYAFAHGLPWTATKDVKQATRIEQSDIEKVRIVPDNAEQEKKQIRYILENAPVDMERKPCTYCRDYRLGYWVTWDGNMRFCSFMKQPDIPIRNSSFSEAWKELIQYEENLEWPPECSSCEVKEGCFKCAAVLETECGSVTQVTEEFCGRIKKYYDKEKGEWLL